MIQYLQGKRETLKQVQGDRKLCQLDQPERGFDFDDACNLYLPFYRYKSNVASLYDQSGKNNHGTITGAIPVILGWYFDGASTINCGDPATLDFGTGDFSFLAWVNVGTAALPDTLSIAFGKEDVTPGYLVGYYASGSIFSFLKTAGGTVSSTDDGVSIRDGAWHLIAVVYDRDSNMTRYKDGSQTGTADSIAARQETVNNAINFLIGTYDAAPNYAFKGYIGEIICLSRVLSATENKNLYEITRKRYGV